MHLNTNDADPKIADSIITIIYLKKGDFLNYEKKLKSIFYYLFK